MQRLPTALIACSLTSDWSEDSRGMMNGNTVHASATLRNSAEEVETLYVYSKVANVKCTGVEY